ncbi:hypothetical protein PACTADRAFT_33127 [Pachysolen tannophilus NRRL Y-2460]|uniref:GrpE protein homolog n=1 Tax=Pachysolen tannophilus NRRL Y-2460 TaxID=669874 RepID=A0A1E4TW04_PACTA|nr:hypothetical protein PACTADRAFT_33127 [Pachysolen tannophilus NRRL Y-2460]
MQRSIVGLTRNIARQRAVPISYRLNTLRTSPIVFRNSAFIRLYATEQQSKNDQEDGKDKSKVEESKDQSNAEAEEKSLEGGNTATSEVEQKLQELEQKYLNKDKEYAELKDLYIRSLADFRNLQETTKREIQKAKDFALQKFAKDLIESIDNFGHALNAVDEKTLDSNKEFKNLYEGVKMTSDIFKKTLEKHGLKEIDAIGEKFDPNKHEATFEVPQPDKEPGTVFHVQQPGYELNGRVLRAAKVGIVKDDK